MYAISVSGKYASSVKRNQICVLLEAKGDKEAIRKAQTIFLQKFPEDYIQEFNFEKINLDATKVNPSERSPVEVKDYGSNSN